jgi:hypothetical protein
MFSISQPTSTPTNKQIPSATPIPTPSSNPRGSIYKSNNQLGPFHFYLKYPNGWSVYQKISSGKKNRVYFDLVPPDVVSSQGVNLLWGGFSVDAETSSSSIEDWFSNWLKTPINGMNNEFNKREYFVYTTKKIGNKTAYLISTSPQAPEIFKQGFIPRYIILGTYYSYKISFFQNGMRNFAPRIENEIFPGLNFD